MTNVEKRQRGIQRYRRFITAEFLFKKKYLEFFLHLIIVIFNYCCNISREIVA